MSKSRICENCGSASEEIRASVRLPGADPDNDPDTPPPGPAVAAAVEVAKQAMDGDHQQNVGVLCEIADVTLRMLMEATERMQNFVDHAHDWTRGEAALEDVFRATPDTGDVLDEFEGCGVFEPVNTLLAYLGEIHSGNFVAFETPQQAAEDALSGFLQNAPYAARCQKLAEALTAALAGRAARASQSPEEVV